MLTQKEHLSDKIVFINCLDGLSAQIAKLLADGTACPDTVAGLYEVQCRLTISGADTNQSI